MKIDVTKSPVFGVQADLAVVLVPEFDEKKPVILAELEERLGELFEKRLMAQQFKGKSGQRILFPAMEGIEASYILVLGVGDVSKASSETLREAAGHAYGSAFQLGAESLVFPLETTIALNLGAKASAQAISEAFILANYHFSEYKKDPRPRPKHAMIAVAQGNHRRAAEQGVAMAEVVTGGVSLARDLVNTPGKDMTPTKLMQAAKHIAESSGGMVQVEILDQKACEKIGMGAYLAVAQGSTEKPQFIHLTYKPEKPSKKIFAFIGKGVTFDSGGLSLKPADFMMTMKCDMAGGAAVLGLFSTLATLKPKHEVHGFIAATENMPSGAAIRPGDVIRAMNGKTVEILNTDAEGRLTLADAMTYAAKYKPTVMIDIATLTGACVVALGEEIAGVMSNNAKLANRILDAASKTGEKFWELPLEKRYRSLLDSDIADIKNIATSRYGGTLTAGLFLQEFVPEGVAWAHIDVAGPAFAERPMTSYLGKGGTGFSVRTLLEFVMDA